MITNLQELLAANDCTGIDVLEWQMCDETELDASLEVEEGGVSLVIDCYWSRPLTYPFSLAEFWSALSELDDESIRESELAEDSALPDEAGPAAGQRPELSEVGGTMNLEAAERRSLLQGDV